MDIRVRTDGPVIVRDDGETVVAVAVATSAADANRLAVGWNLIIDLLAMDARNIRSGAALSFDIECLKSLIRGQLDSPESP